MHQKKRILHSHPSNWAIIADEANIYGNYSTIRGILRCLFVSIQQAIEQFHLAYSKEIDKELFDTALARRNEGCLSVDNSLLRQLLLIILAKNGLMDILRENGEKYTFGDSWAQRFFKRHDIILRVCTSKMREHPAAGASAGASVGISTLTPSLCKIPSFDVYINMYFSIPSIIL